MLVTLLQCWCCFFSQVFYTVWIWQDFRCFGGTFYLHLKGQSEYDGWVLEYIQGFDPTLTRGRVGTGARSVPTETADRGMLSNGTDIWEYSPTLLTSTLNKEVAYASETLPTSAWCKDPRAESISTSEKKICESMWVKYQGLFPLG